MIKIGTLKTRCLDGTVRTEYLNGLVKVKYSEIIREKVKAAYLCLKKTDKLPAEIISNIVNLAFNVKLYKF